MDPASKIIDSVGEAVEKTGKAIDNNFESGEERQEQLTERLRIDMSSDNFLSKNIRPATLIYLMIAFSVIIGFDIAGFEVDPWISSQVSALLFGAFGFYFNSKKAERVYEKKAKAAIRIEKNRQDHELKIEEKKAKLELRRERQELLHEKRMNRKERRAARKS